MSQRPSISRPVPSAAAIALPPGLDGAWPAALLLALILTAAPALAQTPIWSTPTVQPTRNVTVGASALATDASGNLFHVGPCTSATESDICLVKRSAATGAITWSRAFNASFDGADTPVALAVDGSGHPIVAGTCETPARKACLLKYDGATGSLLWRRFHDGQVGLSSATALALAGNDPVLLAACERSGTSFTDFCVTRYAGSNGVPAWSTVLDSGVTVQSNPVDVGVDGAGNVFVTGTCQFTNTDWCTFKLNASGVVQWSSAFNGPAGSTDRARSLAVDGSGNVVVTGECLRAAQSPFGDMDACTVKYAGSNGAVLWSRQYGTITNLNDKGLRVRVDAAGNAYVSMECRDALNFGDICIQKYNASNGNPDWEAVFAGPLSTSDVYGDHAVDASGNLFVTFGCDDGGTFASNTLVCTARFAASNGALSWLQVFGQVDGPSEAGIAIRLDATGNLAVLGNCGGKACLMRHSAASGTPAWTRDGNETIALAGQAYVDGPAVTADSAQRLFARDALGNLYAASICWNGTVDICLTKTSAAGTVLWTAAFHGGGEADVPYAVGLSVKGDPVVAGSCSPVAGQAAKMCAVLFDQNTGAVVWTRLHATAAIASGRGSAVRFNANGDVFVAGACNTAGGDSDLCVMKLAEATGAMLWLGIHDGPDGASDSGNALALDSQGNPAVAGRCVSGGLTTLCVARFSGASGTKGEVLVYTPGSNATDFASATEVAFLGDSTIVAAGVARIFTGAPGATAKHFAVRWDAGKAGTIRTWAVQVPRPDTTDRLAGLGIGPDGDPVLVGTCRAASPAQDDICLAKLDGATGAVSWTATYATAFNESAWGTAVDATGHVYIAGECGTSSSTDLCTLKFDGRNGAQRWIHYESTGAGGIGASRAVIPTADSVYVLADYFVTGQQPGTRVLRVANESVAPTVVLSVRASPNPTSLGGLSWDVTFSESVTGVDATDFALTTTGSVAGAVITGVAGSGATRTVTINRGTGTGTIRLDVLDDDTIADSAGNPLNGVGTGSRYTAGAAFTVFDPVRLVTTTLPALTVGTPVTTTLVASDGQQPYTFGVAAAALPTGLSLDPDTGAISGTPSVAGNFLFQLGVSDDTGAFDASPFNVTVAQGAQAITFAALPNRALGSGTSILAATGGGSGLPVTFASLTPSACSASGTNGTTLTLLAVGTCTIRASQAGNANWLAAANVDRSFSVLASTMTLTVGKTGSGTVTSNPAGINCGATCSASFTTGASVSLGAVPATGFVFANWTGACTGTGACTVTMSAARSVTAVFAPVSHALTVAKAGTGQGGVLSAPAGIDCGTLCTANFTNGTTVALTATAASGSTFTGWGGACTGTGTCQVTMDAARSVSASFALQPAQFVLSVVNATPISGRVQSTPGGIDCGIALICSGTFAAGTVVTLTASPSPHWAFGSWSGACTGTGACQVTMDAARSVTVNWVPAPSQFVLSVANPTPIWGRVQSSPGGIDCGIALICSDTFAAGTVVTLTASPSPNFVFGGWSGGGCSGTAPCQVTMDAAKSVSAEFKPTSAIPRLANISTRMQVLTGADVLIGGFIIGGSQPKTVVVRARGPSLIPLGVPNALANPVLQLFSGPTQIDANDNWQQAANQATIFSSGFAPSDPLESAIYTTLNPGAYTAIVTGANLGTGVAIIEVFEVDKPEVPLLNIATRGKVLTGGDVMIGGFIIQGDAPQTVVVRARGPSLEAQGVPGALQDPVLQIFAGQAVIASNDDWQSSPDAATIQSAGFAPSDTRESVIRITLNPGAYTAIVTGKNGTTGVGIIEVFAQ